MPEEEPIGVKPEKMESENQTEFLPEQMAEIEKLSGEIIDATKKIQAALSEDEKLLLIHTEIQGDQCPLSPYINDKDKQGNSLGDKETVHFSIGYPGHSIQNIPRLHSVTLGRSIEDFACHSMEYVRYDPDKQSLYSRGIFNPEEVKEDLFNTLRDLQSELKKENVTVTTLKEIKT